MLKHVAAAALILAAAIPAYAQATNKLSPEKEALLLKARKAWSAFECSAVAAQIPDPAQQARLFTYGLEEGRAFLKAAQENKFSRADASQIVPIGFLMVMEGPSHDFMLGRLWENTVDNALKDITKSKDGLRLDDDIIRIKAKTKFNEDNCMLMGR
jgi:hypothetical protein